MSIVASSKGRLGMGRRTRIDDSISETVTHRFTFTVLSALRGSDQVTRSMIEEDVSLQVMSKDEYVVKICSSQERSKIISRLKIKISSQRSRSKITSMQKELQKNSQGYKVPRSMTSQEVKPYVQ
ncbi:hypothetical protein Tco_1423536 [Tanacetum coccineum]